MALGKGIIALSRLRPITSQIGSGPGGGLNPGNLNVGNGVGINYAMGVGSIRLAGVTYSIWDASYGLQMSAQAFIARIAVINGQYAGSAQGFQVTTDLNAYDVLYDAIISDAGPTFLPMWASGIVTDNGESATAMISCITWPGGGAPGGIAPQSKLIMHADYYASRDLALSPGSIFTP